MRVFRWIYPFLVLLFIGLSYTCAPTDRSQNRFSFDKLELVAYTWYTDYESQQFKFYTRYYFSVDSMGNCLIAGKDQRKGPESYYQSLLPESFDSIINSYTFSPQPVSYFAKSGETEIYDGFTYVFLWHIGDSIRTVEFHPHHIVDARLKSIFELIDNYATTIDSAAAASFDYTQTIQYIYAHVVDSTRFPPSPRPRVNFMEELPKK